MKELYSTERLIIRKWQLTDAEDLYDYCSDPKVTKFLTFPTYKKVEEAHDRLKFVTETYTKAETAKSGEDKTDYAIELKETKKVIGSIGFAQYTEKAGGVVEVGYILNSKHQGKGYMTEALRGLFKYIKKNKLAMRIEAKHDVENAESGAVMKRAGMTFEGIHRKMTSNNKNDRADMAYYSILYEEII